MNDARHALFLALAALLAVLPPACGGPATAGAGGAPDTATDGGPPDSRDAALPPAPDSADDAVADGADAPPLPAVGDLPERPDVPDPLVLLDGERVTTPAQWRERGRPELLRLLQHYAYGYTPAGAAARDVRVVVSAPDFLDGAATLEVLRFRAGPLDGIEIELLLVAPNGAAAPPPAFLGLNFFGNHAVHPDPRIPLSERWLPERGAGVVDHRATEAARGTAADRWPLARIVERGYALATLYHGDVDPDVDDFSNGVHPLYHDPAEPARGAHEWGAVGAWAWGLSRAVDVLAAHGAVDPGRIAVVGHSRNGKAALWAAAQDERIALVVSNQSGCMGAALSRRRQGETLLLMNAVYPHWFAPTLRAFDEREAWLPFDQHQVIALVAPRPVLVTSAVDDAWADPLGEFLGAQGAAPVYALLGAGGLDAAEPPPPGTLTDSVIGYHIRPGGHGIGAEDWEVFLQFADARLR